jgi:hypothetical protein
VHPLGRGVEAGHLAQQDVRVALPAQDRPERRRDVAGGQQRRRHLVQQRLEQVVVRAVDQRDLGVRALQAAHHAQPAEPTSDNDNPVLAHGSRIPTEAGGYPAVLAYPPGTGVSGRHDHHR